MFIVKSIFLRVVLNVIWKVQSNLFKELFFSNELQIWKTTVRCVVSVKILDSKHCFKNEMTFVLLASKYWSLWWIVRLISDNLKRKKIIVKSCTNSLLIVIWDFVKLITINPMITFSVIALNHLNVFRCISQICLLTVHLSTFEKYYL